MHHAMQGSISPRATRGESLSIEPSTQSCGPVPIELSFSPDLAVLGHYRGAIVTVLAKTILSADTTTVYDVTSV